MLHDACSDEGHVATVGPSLTRLKLHYARFFICRLSLTPVPLRNHEPAPRADAMALTGSLFCDAVDGRGVSCNVLP